MNSLTIDLQDDVADALRESAAARDLPIEQVAAEAIARFTREVDRAPWTAEDLAAIKEGLEQAGCGETSPHEEVMASVRTRLAG